MNTWEYEGQTFKKCPQCKRAILAEWNSHNCGWGKDETNKNEAVSGTTSKISSPVKTADKIEDIDMDIGKEIIRLEKIIEALENDTKLYALFKDDRKVFWELIKHIRWCIPCQP
jgi:hypothetical protein